MKYLKHLVKSFFCAVALCVWFGGAQATEMHIRIPENSSMQLRPPPDEYTHLVSFQGEVQLQGQLLLISEYKATDYGENQEPLYFEWRTSLLFQPTLSERSKLPKVRYASEPEEPSELWIETDYLQEEQKARIIAAIFGAEVAAKIGKEEFELGKRGYLTLRSYRTGVECDHRDHYADFYSFDNTEDLSASQVGELVKQIRGCGR